MNEYTVLFLNGIKADIMADDWKDAVVEAKCYALKGQFQNNIKLIMDDENNVIRDIDTNQLTFKYEIY